MTYLQLINEVLSRLREPQVTTIAQNEYSSLIGNFVNDAKRQVEDAYNWGVLDTVITVNTISGTSTYTVTGSGNRQKDVTVNNVTGQYKLSQKPSRWISEQQQLTTTTPAQPTYYAWTGFDGTDTKVELFPTPDMAYVLKFNMNIAQAKLTADGDVLLVPSDPVIASAYARALVERGEDGGMLASEAYGLYKGVLADFISLESGRTIEDECWVAN